MLRPSIILTNMGLLHRVMASQVCTGLAKGGGGGGWQGISLDDSGVSCVSE